MVRSLQGRLLRALLSVALVTLLAGIAGVFSLHLLTARLEQLTLHTWPSTDAAQELSRSFHKGVGGLEQFLAGNRLTSRKTIADARARATTELARLVDSEAVTVGLAQELQQLFAQMTAIQDRLIGLKELDLQLERAIEDHWSRTHQQLERVIEVLAQDRATTADLLNAALELYRSLVPALDEHLGIDQAQLQHSIGWLRALPSYPWYRDALAPFTDGIDRLAALDREHVGNLHTIGQLRGEHERLVAQLERRLSRTEARLRKEMLDNATAGTALARDAQALLIGAVVVAAALAALLALYLSRLIGHPLNQLRDAVDELLKDRGRRVDIRTGDELQSLGTAFNRMAENLDATSVSRDYLDSIFASMLDGLFVIGRDGRVELANRAASDLLERPPESLRGVPLRDLLHLNGDPLGQASPPPTAAGEGLLRGSLEAIPVLFSLALMQDGGERYVLAIRDIRERKRKEADLRAAKEAAEAGERIKTEFLTNISHEIRTPLNGVIGMLQLLQASPQDDEQREYTRVAHRSAETLLQLLNDILDLSRLNAGKLLVESLPFPPRTLAEEVCELFAPLAAEKGLEIICLVHAAVPPTVIGDPVRLRQLLVNLVGNAVKFTEHGEVVVELDYSTGADGNPCLDAHVRDTGIGIEPEVLGRLFEPFTQADGRTSRRYGGTGLGLAIVRQLSELLGGTISCHSQPGHGSTFTVRLPCPVADVDVPTSHARFAGRRLLFVSPNAALRRACASLLEPMAVQHASCDSLEDPLAREADAAHPGWDAIIVDHALLEREHAARARQLAALRNDHSTRLLLLAYPNQRAQSPAGTNPLHWLDKPLRTRPLHQALERIFEEPAAASADEAVEVDARLPLA